MRRCTGSGSVLDQVVADDVGPGRQTVVYAREALTDSLSAFVSLSGSPPQGLLYGTGQAFIVPLILSLPTQWFFAHRGLATGLVGGFAGLGGAINVIFARELIARFAGSRKTLGVLSGLQAGVGVLALLLIRERRVAPMRVDWRRGRLVPSVAVVPEEPRDEVEKGNGGEKGMAPVLVEERDEPKPTNRGTEVPGGLRRIFRTSTFWSFWIGIFISTL